MVDVWQAILSGFLFFLDQGLFSVVLLFIPIEMLLVYRFGRTLGKWVMGIKITSREPLTLGQSFVRSFYVGTVGMGAGSLLLGFLLFFYHSHRFSSAHSFILDTAFQNPFDDTKS